MAPNLHDASPGWTSGPSARQALFAGALAMVIILVMKLHCPECGSPIPAADVDLSTGSAKCVRCDNVFTFGTDAAARRPPAAPQHPAVRPARMSVDEWGGIWTARWRWFSPVHLFLAFFCAAWDSFLVFWYTMAFTDRNAPWIMVVFPIAHLAVGVGLTYFVLTGFLNRTTVRVAGGTLSVHHGPLPWRQPPSLDGHRIDHLTTAWDLATRRPGNPFTTTLSALLSDGSTVRLISGLRGAEESDWLRQELEQRFKLQPGPAMAAVPAMAWANGS